METDVIAPKHPTKYNFSDILNDPERKKKWEEEKAAEEKKLLDMRQEVLMTREKEKLRKKKRQERLELQKKERELKQNSVIDEAKEMQPQQTPLYTPPIIPNLPYQNPFLASYPQVPAYAPAPSYPSYPPENPNIRVPDSFSLKPLKRKKRETPEESEKEESSEEDEDEQPPPKKKRKSVKLSNASDSPSFFSSAISVFSKNFVPSLLAIGFFLFKGWAQNQIMLRQQIHRNGPPPANPGPTFTLPEPQRPNNVSHPDMGLSVRPNPVGMKRDMFK
jgi:hypothetical protein